MANEHLKRVITHRGDVKKWTASWWMKNNNVDQGYTSIFGAGDDDGSPSNVYNEIYFNGSQIGLNLDNASDPENYSLSTEPLLRDPNAWSHFCVSFTDQGDNANTRVKFYINGSLVQNNTSTGLDTTEYSFFNNENYVSYIGSRVQQNAGTTTFDGQFFDFYIVDGQALGPEVFGFFKHKLGYQINGNGDTIDVDGIWRPRLPRSVKETIDRRGGFGQNGFYLPMNDTSNPGYDFHTTPTSIIKLKGEELPQPKCGIPSTSDNFVSQLRSDPFAANLVLAIPGINTPTTGSELITNGTFDTDVSSWTAQPSNSLTHQPDGTAKATRGGGAEVATQVITTVVGQTYELSVDVTEIEGSHGQVYVNSSGDLNTSIGYSFSCGSFKGTFTADTTSTDISLYAHPAGPTSYDNVSVKATTIQDYSADIKGSGSNHTLTINNDCGVRSVFESANPASHYGSAISFEDTGDSITMSGSSDFNFGTGNFTIEAWVKPRTLSGTHQIISCAVNNENWQLMRHSSGVLRWNSRGTNDGSTSAYNTTYDLPLNQWSHVAVSREDDILRIFLNGVPIGHFYGYASNLNFDGSPCWGAWDADKDLENWRGCMTDMRIYKGVAKYIAPFDIAKPYFPVDIEQGRVTPDTCINNFATLNPLYQFNSGATNQVTFSNGNLKAQSALNDKVVQANMGVRTGKWYWETRIYNDEMVGIGSIGGSMANYPGANYNGISYHKQGQVYRGQGPTNYGAGWSNSDYHIIGCAADLDNNILYWHVDGTWANSANPNAGTGGYSITSDFNGNLPTAYITPAWRVRSSGATEQVHVNFGQNPSFGNETSAGTFADASGKGLFKFEVPTGYNALCDTNLIDESGIDPGKHFKCNLWTGNGDFRNIYTGFEPGLVWIKPRNFQDNHVFFDVVRGVGETLYANNESGITARTTARSVNFGKTGYNVTTWNNLNDPGDTYVGWSWKAGGAPVTNNDGSIATQVSANQEAGFSIVTGTMVAGNKTLGHGLGKKPSFIVTKQRNGTTGWYSYHANLGAGKNIRLDTTADATTNSNIWNDTEPTDQVFTMASGFGAGEAYVAYCWAEIRGYSKIGAFQGRSNDDGTFVYCGFRPAWVLIKATNLDDSAWILVDSARDPYNPCTQKLFPDFEGPENLSSPAGADSSTNHIDLLSNGFKCRKNNTWTNDASYNYIFVAFAESPFSVANAK